MHTGWEKRKIFRNKDIASATGTSYYPLELLFKFQRALTSIVEKYKKQLLGKDRGKSLIPAFGRQSQGLSMSFRPACFV